MESWRSDGGGAAEVQRQHSRTVSRAAPPYNTSRSASDSTAAVAVLLGDSGEKRSDDTAEDMRNGDMPVVPHEGSKNIDEKREAIS